MMKRAAALILAAVAVCPCLAAADSPIANDDFERWHRLMKPGPGEWRWMQVSWFPGHEVWAARQEAARQGKPLLLWYMAGEPLGPC